MIQFNFKAIGTTWRIDIFEDIDVAKESEILTQIQSRIELFDKAYSRFRDDSLVTKMSKESGIFVLPADAEPMMSLYHELYLHTGGLLTPLVGNLISDAGYDAQYSLQQKKELHAPPAWEDVIEYTNPKMLTKKPVLLDFGAAGKGYLVDLVGDLLEVNGITDYSIDAGGDILHANKKKDQPAIRVGLEDPQNKDQVIGVCFLKNGSICGSAGNRRAWGKFTHIMNPKTLTSPTNIIAVWVTAKTALLADALATCLFFVPAHTLSAFYDFEYIIVYHDRSLETSPHFPGEIFTAE